MITGVLSQRNDERQAAHKRNFPDGQSEFVSGGENRQKKESAQTEAQRPALDLLALREESQHHEQAAGTNNRSKKPLSGEGEGLSRQELPKRY
jgi:hypothetical protein